jgi:hypothetical protein
MSDQPNTEQETPPIQPAAPSPSVEDDFGDEQLGERQPQVCSLEDGCAVCQ